MTVEQKRCALCGVRNHALGGRTAAGEFLLALPMTSVGGATSWPRQGTNGWCGEADGEVHQLTVVRIVLSRTTVLNGTPAPLCQHCMRSHHARQGVLTDLFAAVAS